MFFRTLASWGSYPKGRIKWGGDRLFNPPLFTTNLNFPPLPSPTIKPPFFVQPVYFSSSSPIREKASMVTKNLSVVSSRQSIPTDLKRVNAFL